MKKEEIKSREKDSSEKKSVYERAIVKQSNQLAEVPFQNFTPREIDFFMAICYKVQGRGLEKVWISFDEFRALIGYTRRGDDRLIEELKGMSNKFSRINLMEKKKSGFKIIVPFIDFEADTETRMFCVGVHPEFASALNELDGSPGKRYTLADVVSISRMSSVYSKQCLRMLFLYRNTGYWFVTIEELRYYLDVPPSYTNGDITRRVLKTIQQEFSNSGIFEKFEITPRKDEMRKSSGRKKITGYTFAFRFADSIINDPDAVAKTEPDFIKCPKCGKPLKKIKRKDGEGFFFGHKDGWDENAECRYTISEVVADSKVVSSSPKKREEGEVTEGELSRYYEYIRVQEREAEAARKEDIKENAPNIWALYEEKVRCQSEYINEATMLSFTEEGKERKQRAFDKASEAAEALNEALESAGFPKDYMETHYRCDECKDTGARDDGFMCSCRKERVKEAYEWLHE